MGMRIDVEVGYKFGRLTVEKRSNNIGANSAWLCKCECGNKKIIRGVNLHRGFTKSCGCLIKENGQYTRTHGEGNTRGNLTVEYRAWQSAKTRCYNPKNKSYKIYGGRGISMCDAWLNSYETFLKDMGRAPPKTSLDRFPDMNGPYAPDNCRWATKDQQANNTRSNKFFEWNGEKLTYAQIARRSGINQYSLRDCVANKLLPLEQAIRHLLILKKSHL